jgi:hypothetical protein
MPASGRRRPRVEAERGFALLMELYDKGRGLDTKSKIEAITKFLAISQPWVAKQIKWGWMFKSERADAIVNVLRWGLNEFRDGKPFLRSGPTSEGLFGPLGDLTEKSGKFQDGVVWDPSHGRAVRMGSTDPAQVFLTRVFELLTEVAPWLRVCKREDCRRFFLFHRSKQIYCGKQCAQLVRKGRFLGQRALRSGDRRGGRRK